MIRFTRRAALLALFGCAAIAARAETPGGRRPGDTPDDRDPRLTALARAAQPIIVAIERFRAANRRFPSAEEAAGLEIERIKGRNAGQFAAFGEWLYHPERDGSGYTLSRKLGWDPRLIFQREGTAQRWIYDPGDGAAQKEIILEP